MRKFLVAFIAMLALLCAGAAQACVSAGHGGLTDCQVAPDGQHCFVGKIRSTPHFGANIYELDVQASLGLSFEPSFVGCTTTPQAVSSWVMFAGTSSNNWVQIGYVKGC